MGHELYYINLDNLNLKGFFFVSNYSQKYLQVHGEYICMKLPNKSITRDKPGVQVLYIGLCRTKCATINLLRK